MKILQTILIVLLVQVVLVICGLVTYFELRTPKPTFATHTEYNQTTIGGQI